MRSSIIFAALALAGCGTMYSGMSAEQIAAMSKDKQSDIVCVKATGPWGAAVTTFVNTDKGVIKQGSITVDDACKVTYSNDDNKGTTPPILVPTPTPPTPSTFQIVPSQPLLVPR